MNVYFFALARARSQRTTIEGLQDPAGALASEVSALFGYAERWAIAGPVLLILPAWRVASNILTDRKKKAAELLQEKRTEARIRATEAKREKERRERENRDQELKELKQGLLAAAKGWQLGKGSADVNRKRTQRTVDDLVKKLIQLNSVKSQLLYSQPDSKDRMPGPSNIEEMGNWSLIFISEGNRQGPDGLEVLDIPFVEVDPFIQIISAKDGSKTGNTRDPSSSPSQPQSDEQRQLVATNTANISSPKYEEISANAVRLKHQVKIELPAMLQRQVEWRTLYLDEDLRIDRVGGDGIYLFQREGTMKELPSGGESTQETQATQKAQPTPTTSTAPQRSPTTPAPQTTPATRTDVIRK
ncbi:hypothetical protein CBR_g25862 [Chara braunii]|uniref:Plastid lipid-associated protein/fibrillin conserved domain-containing protein n=1 Tax=Chara braunii TaxID=69332 RepID=A0A388L6I9_CHABU|nr:hypothetical protein CBR_g25862 [Chara braunii]|eukprot:GBG77931.1 hypothetical protein CBR_g25862 [Chara braunii]